MFLKQFLFDRTLKHDHTDHSSIEPIEKYKPIDYVKPDGKLTFDLLSSVALTGILPLQIADICDLKH